MVFADVIPGFSLMQATRDGHGWLAGQYGLVETNDPTVVFDGPLLQDPAAGLTDDKINNLPAAECAAVERFMTVAEQFGEKLVLDAHAGYRLVHACISKGYSPDEDGHVEFWLMHFIASQVFTSAKA